MATPNRDLALWNKLTALPLDRLAEEPVPEVGFNKRLMREQKWDFATAIRVAAEYRRFLFLTQFGPVSPSEGVDAAWHQHLTYTRAYNIGLCERTLGRPLDHTPSGGAADTAHYKSVYQDTLDRYRATFNEEAPADIWPPAHGRVTVRQSRNQPGNQSGQHRTGQRLIGTCLVGLAAFFVLVVKLKMFWPFFLIAIFLAISMSAALAKDGKKKDASGCGSACGGGDGGGHGGGGDGGGCGSGCGGGGCG